MSEDKQQRIAYFKRRLAMHRRRLRYWSGNPSITGYGPKGRQLKTGHMDHLQYELSKADAYSVAEQLDFLGVKVEVIDPRRTFQHRYNNPGAPALLIWPVKKKGGE